MIPSSTRVAALLATISSVALVGVRDNGLGKEPAQTNAAEPELVVIESRQVRRARERREAKHSRR